MTRLSDHHLKTRLSDHHTILKTKFEKFKPKKSIYRNMLVTTLNLIFLMVCLL